MVSILEPTAVPSLLVGEGVEEESLGWPWAWVAWAGRPVLWRSHCVPGEQVVAPGFVLSWSPHLDPGRLTC